MKCILRRGWIAGSSPAMTRRRSALPKPESTNESARIRLLHGRTKGAERVAHALGAGAERAGRARPRDRPVLWVWLQHRKPHRLGNRKPETPFAHHHRHDGHAHGDRADA